MPKISPSLSSLALIASLAIAGTASAQEQNSKAIEPVPGQVPPLPPHLKPDIPAFPGAWGGGMFTTGGRGGKVIAVTTLADSGPGSLRAAIDASEPRIIVFQVAGTIRLESNLDIESPSITIAGQSAPGDGICVSHGSININTHNVIIRHLRVRRGNPNGGQGSDNIGGHPESHVIVDHCSVSWGRDENISLYRHMKEQADGKRVKLPTKNVTIQWVISSEALGPGHEFGGTWGGTDSTFHHNLFACNSGRNPSIGMSGEFDYRNNVLFNWAHRTMDGGDETSLVNVINNYYKAGPAVKSNMRTIIARMEERTLASPTGAFKLGNWYPEMPKRPGKWYVAGNFFHGEAEVTADNWKGMRGTMELARVNTPFTGWPVNQQSAASAFESVLAKGGATLPKRDIVDQRITECVRTGKTTTERGIINNPNEVGGFPELTFSPEDVPADTDKDGMPDAWEKSHELSPNDPSDGAADTDKDGYSNVEEFLNGTNPKQFIDYRDLSHNNDTISG